MYRVGDNGRGRRNPLRRKVHLSAGSLLVALIVASGVLASPLNAQPTATKPTDEVVDTAEDISGCTRVVADTPSATTPAEEAVDTAEDIVVCFARAVARS